MLRCNIVQCNIPREMTVNNPLVRSYVEVMNFYGTTLEYTLRAHKLAHATMERSVQEQIDLADATVAQIKPLANVTKASELLGVQQDMFRGLGDQVRMTATNLLKIQKEARDDWKALVEEGVETFAPPAMGKLLGNAA